MRAKGTDEADLNCADEADGSLLLLRLRALGLENVSSLTFTRNRLTMVSLRGGTLRVHESFGSAPESVLRGIVDFFVGRKADVRRAARRVILDFAGPRPAGPPRRRGRGEADREVEGRLAEWHRELNERHFEGKLAPMEPHVSGRMRSRLGHYSPGSATTGAVAEIVISRRHIRRDGFKRVVDTLLHEMVHQWQDQNGIPLNHGKEFRRKAREVGTAPSARRPRDVSLSQ